MMTIRRNWQSVELLPLATLVCAYFGYSLRPSKESTLAREACRETIKNALQ